LSPFLIIAIHDSLFTIHARYTDGAVTDSTAALTFKEVIATGTAASVTLSWTEGDATETNYDIQRKTSAEGTYASVGTPVPESFVDSTVVEWFWMDPYMEP